MNNQRPTYEELEKKIAKLEKTILAQKKSVVEDKDCANILQNFPALIWRSGLDKLCYYFNETWLNFTGRTMEQENGNGWAEGVHPDDFDKCLEIYTNSFDNRLPFEMDYRLKNAQGEYRWIKDFGQPVYSNKRFDGYIGACYDVTEIKEKKREFVLASEELAIKERRLNFVLEVTNSGVWEWNIETNEEYFSPKWCEIIGFDAGDEMLPNKFSSWQERIHPDDLKYVMKSLELHLKENVPFNINYRHKHKTGEYRWQNSIGEAIRDDNGKPIRMIGRILDITEEKMAEEELISAKQKAEENDKLKSAFLQNMSHEIRTPLNAICGFSKLLFQKNLSEDKFKSYVSIINNSSEQLLNIVTDILTISAIETNQEKAIIEKVNVNGLLIELLAIYKLQAENHNVSIFVHHSLPDEKAIIEIDKTKLTQIFINLLSNALKFTHTGTINFGYNIENNEIIFFVKDTGIGIHPSMQETIFERFSQGDPNISSKYGGTGLGLSICKGFIDLLGGKIWLESNLGKGSNFYFSFPFKKTYNPEIGAEEMNNTSSEATKILIAEDEEINYLYLEQLCLMHDINFLHASNGEEALNMCLDDHSIKFVLMDIKMPVMSGYEAAKKIKDKRNDIIIVAQTAYALQNERTKYKDIFDDYLSKPFYEKSFLEIIKKYYNPSLNSLSD